MSVVLAVSSVKKRQDVVPRLVKEIQDDPNSFSESLLKFPVPTPLISPPSVSLLIMSLFSGTQPTQTLLSQAPKLWE